MSMYRARVIKFTHEIQVAPGANGLMTSLDIENDDLFRAGINGSMAVRGEITLYGSVWIDEIARKVRIENPRHDPQTGKSFVRFLPLERVVDWEPLSEEVEAKLYPKDLPKEQTAASVPIPQAIKQPRHPVMG